MKDTRITCKFDMNDMTLTINDPNVEFEIGEKVILCEYVDDLTHDRYFDIYPDNGVGRPGNMDSENFAYHGWRGSTNGLSEYVHGLRRISKWEFVEDKYGKEYIKVTFGSDLAKHLK